MSSPRSLAFPSIALAALLSACTAIIGGPPDPQTSDPIGAASGEMELGVVSGGLYETRGPAALGLPESQLSVADSMRVRGQGLDKNASEILCEMQSLGAKWLRIEYGWGDTDKEVYRNIARAANVAGVKLIVVIPNRHECIPDDGDAAGITSADVIDDVVARLDEAAYEVFSTSDTRVAAFEITNEPNDTRCPAGGNRVGPRTMVSLLRRVWSWKPVRAQWLAANLPAEAANPELIVSGGTLNGLDITSSSWWAGLLDGLGSGGEPYPFDHFSVHPYNPYSYHNATVNSTTCADGVPPYECNGIPQWHDSVRDSIVATSQALDAIDNTRTVPSLFVTEIGWQRCDPEVDNCDCLYDSPTDDDTSPDNAMCLNEEKRVARAMGYAFRALADSGVVDVALWYDYRDDDTSNGATYGLRERFDPAHGRAPAKLDVMAAFRTAAGGTIADCWNGDVVALGAGAYRGGATNRAIANCYLRGGAAVTVGGPSDNGGGRYVHAWGPDAGRVQDFDGGSYGPSMCLLRPGESTAWMLRGEIRKAYLAAGGPYGALGYPLADEAVSASVGTMQRFEHGVIRWSHGDEKFLPFIGE